VTRPLPFGLLAMSVDAAIPDRFWPVVRWACTYVFSWILPLMAAEEVVAGRLASGAVLSLLTLLDWIVAAKWDWFRKFINKRRRVVALALIMAGTVLLAAGIAVLAYKPSQIADAGSASLATPDRASFKLTMLDAFTNRKIIDQYNVVGPYPWVFRQDKDLYWIILFEKQFPAQSLEIKINDVEAPSGSYSIRDLWPQGIVVKTPIYNNDDVIEIRVLSKKN